MGDLLHAVVHLVHAVTEAGPFVCLAVTGAGFLLLILGFHGYRPCAALVTGASTAGAILGAEHLGLLALQTSPQTSAAAAGIVGFALGLVWPGLALILGLGLSGGLAGLQFARAQTGQLALALPAVGLAAGVLPPALFYTNLAGMVPPAVAGLLIALGGWAYVGVEHRGALVYDLPIVWILIAAVIMLADWPIEAVRLRRFRERQAKEGDTDEEE